MSAVYDRLRTEPERVALHAREVAFDWAGMPLRWIPDEPFASHMLNVLHVLLPEDERRRTRACRTTSPSRGWTPASTSPISSTCSVGSSAPGT